MISSLCLAGLVLAAAIAVLRATRLESLVGASLLAQLGLAALTALLGAVDVALVQAALAALFGILALSIAPPLPRDGAGPPLTRSRAVHVLVAGSLALLLAHPFLATNWLAPAADEITPGTVLGTSLLGRHALVLLTGALGVALTAIAATHLLRDPHEDAP
jgi:hypothetical protein